MSHPLPTKSGLYRCTKNHSSGMQQTVYRYYEESTRAFKEEADNEIGEVRVAASSGKYVGPFTLMVEKEPASKTLNHVSEYRCACIEQTFGGGERVIKIGKPVPGGYVGPFYKVIIEHHSGEIDEPLRAKAVQRDKLLSQGLRKLIELGYVVMFYPWNNTAVAVRINKYGDPNKYIEAPISYASLEKEIDRTAYLIEHGELGEECWNRVPAEPKKDMALSIEWKEPEVIIGDDNIRLAPGAYWRGFSGTGPKEPIIISVKKGAGDVAAKQYLYIPIFEPKFPVMPQKPEYKLYRWKGKSENVASYHYCVKQANGGLLSVTAGLYLDQTLVEEVPQ